MPWDRSKYPEDWDQLREAVLERADNCCETCGLPNGRMGARDTEGVFWNADVIDGMDAAGRLRVFGTTQPRIFRLVLTVAHICQHTECRDMLHLIAECQQCHLRRDKEQHQRNAALTRAAKKAKVE
jgi:hypothetical protein